MNTRTRWISGLSLLVIGVGWGVLVSSREADSVRGVRRPIAERSAAEARPDGPAPSAQRAEVVVPDAPQPAALEPRLAQTAESPPVPRSPFARDLDAVAASFLTASPRVTDLLDLVEKLAAGAVVAPDSVTIQRDEEGELLSARGAFAIGDVRGTFHVDRDGYRVLIRSAVGDASWSQRDIQISFEEDESGPRGCHALVQFHPGTDANDAGAGDEKLVGWSVGASPGLGANARPLTLGLTQGEWRIRDSSRLQVQEFPWLSDIEGFRSWLERLKPCLANEPHW